jgi:hypothetical protein
MKTASQDSKGLFGFMALARGTTPKKTFRPSFLPVNP